MLDSPLDARFGRAPRFLIYDLDSKTFEMIDNQQNLNAAQGAGIQSAETVARKGAKALVTGHCGPKAYRVLKAAGIRIYTSAVATVSGKRSAISHLVFKCAGVLLFLIFMTACLTFLIVVLPSLSTSFSREP